MAYLYITEFALAGHDGKGKVAQVAHHPAIENQRVSISGTSAQSAALNASTALVRVQADAACCITVGADPTATASMMPLAAGAAEYISVPVGQSLKIAAITI